MEVFQIRIRIGFLCNGLLNPDPSSIYGSGSCYLRVIKKAGSGSIFRFLAGSGSIKIEFGSETLLGDFDEYKFKTTSEATNGTKALAQNKYRYFKIVKP